MNEIKNKLNGKKYYRIVDIELTNACNMNCMFCPRDCTPPQGIMNIETFKCATERAVEMGNLKLIQLCGLGEPLLHPKAVEMVDYLNKKNIDFNVSTNASLLTSELSRRLIDAGLKSITFSVSGLNQKYEQIHKDDFPKIKSNILNFLKIVNGQCKIQMAVTVFDKNKDDIDDIRKNWENEGVSKFFFFEYNNRGGLIDKGYYFTQSKKFCGEAKKIMIDNKIPHECLTPFMSVFIGWNGNYYLCCNDYKKNYALGTVFDSTIDEIDDRKRNLLNSDCYICGKCDTYPLNIIREYMFRVEKNEATENQLNKKIEEYKSWGN